MELSGLLDLNRAANLLLLARIKERCDVTASGCWVWQGPHSGEGRGGGYGRFCFSGRTASVHRTVFILCKGPIPPGKQIDHSCNNRACCNPMHLECMTHKKNQKLRDKRRSKALARRD